MSILQKFEGFTIWSDNYLELAKWYEETFELKRMHEINVPDDQAVAFEIEPGNEMMLWIGKHSEVEGKSKDSYRLMISYIVQSADEVYEKLKLKKTKVIAEPHNSPDNTLRVLTLMDPEDNLIQLFSKIE